MGVQIAVAVVVFVGGAAVGVGESTTVVAVSVAAMVVPGVMGKASPTRPAALHGEIADAGSLAAP